MEKLGLMAAEILVGSSSRIAMANGAQSVIMDLTKRQATWLANKWDIDDVIKYWIMSSK